MVAQSDFLPSLIPTSLDFSFLPYSGQYYNFQHHVRSLSYFKFAMKHMMPDTDPIYMSYLNFRPFFQSPWHHVNVYYTLYVYSDQEDLNKGDLELLTSSTSVYIDLGIYQDEHSSFSFCKKIFLRPTCAEFHFFYAHVSCPRSCDRDISHPSFCFPTCHAKNPSRDSLLFSILRTHQNRQFEYACNTHAFQRESRCVITPLTSLSEHSHSELESISSLHAFQERPLIRPFASPLSTPHPNIEFEYTDRFLTYHTFRASVTSHVTQSLFTSSLGQTLRFFHIILQRTLGQTHLQLTVTLRYMLKPEDSVTSQTQTPHLVILD